MLYNTNINIVSTAGEYKIINKINDKKVTVLSYNLNSVGGQEIIFKTASGNLTNKLKFEGGRFATFLIPKLLGN